MSTMQPPHPAPVITDTPVMADEYEVPEGSPHPELHMSHEMTPTPAPAEAFHPKGYVHGQTEGTGDHQVTIHDISNTTQPMKPMTRESLSLRSVEPFWLYPTIVGGLFLGAWFICNLVLQGGSDASPFNAGVTPFVIQMSTFGIAVCLGWYAMNDNTNKPYVLCAVYNYIMVCMYLLHIVETMGFFVWNKNQPYRLAVCFPNAYESQLGFTPDSKTCDAFKASSIFSLFIMLIHFVWMCGYATKAMYEIRWSWDSNGLLLILNGINMFSFFLWWTGVIGVADQKHVLVSGGEMEYILILCITLCTLLSFAYILSPTHNILCLSWTWHWITCFMLWSTTLLLARTTDSSSKVSTPEMSSSGGKAIATSAILFLMSHTISALTFTLMKIGILN